jgi:hypothetical protein
MNSTVDGNMNGYVNDMQGVRKSAEDMLRRAGDMSNGATVTWIGYEPSSFDGKGSLPGLATGENAAVGGDKLAKFDQGINASRTTDPHFTALGHSQGSIVTGVSLTHGGTGVDDAVVFGSPGVADHFGIDNTAADLKVPQGHAYNITAADDDVARWVPESWRYGAAPYAMDGMTQLSADAATGAGRRAAGVVARAQRVHPHDPGGGREQQQAQHRCDRGRQAAADGSRSLRDVS